jgi:hypothetical protein
MAKVWLELLCERKGQKALVETIKEPRFLAFSKAFILARHELTIRSLEKVDKQLAVAEKLKLKGLKRSLDYLIPSDEGKNGNDKGQRE